MNMDELLGNLSSTEIPTDIEGLTAYVSAFINGFGPVLVISIIAFLAVVATWSWRLLKLALPVVGAIIFANVGAMVAPMVVNAAQMDYVGPVSVNALVIMLCALLGAILMGVLYKLAIILVGAAGGWVVGNVVSGFITANQPDLELFQWVDGNMPLGYIIVSAICAVILGLLAVFIFKALYILITSVGSMITAGSLVGATIINYADENALTVLGLCTFVGIIVGIICAVHQFKTAND